MKITILFINLTKIVFFNGALVAIRLFDSGVFLNPGLSDFSFEKPDFICFLNLVLLLVAKMCSSAFNYCQRSFRHVIDYGTQLFWGYTCPWLSKNVFFKFPIFFSPKSFSAKFFSIVRIFVQ